MSDQVNMHQLVAELQKIMPFKKGWTGEGDIVLIAALDPQMLAFGVVSSITRDTSRRDEWYHVRIQLLGVPLQTMTWILRPEQMSGREIFTMGGKQRFMAPLALDTSIPDPVTEERDSVVEKKKTEKKNKKVASLRVVK